MDIDDLLAFASPGVIVAAVQGMSTVEADALLARVNRARGRMLARREIPANAPSIAGLRGGGPHANPMKKPEPKAVRRFQKRIAARRLSHSATLQNVARLGGNPAGYRTPGSQKK